METGQGLLAQVALVEVLNGRPAGIVDEPQGRLIGSSGTALQCAS